MTRKTTLTSVRALGGAMLMAALAGPALAAEPLVRVAQLDIDPAQVAAYQAAVKEEIEASVRL